VAGGRGQLKLRVAGIIPGFGRSPGGERDHSLDARVVSGKTKAVQPPGAVADIGLAIHMEPTLVIVSCLEETHTTARR
jgi:hypothetical protein